MGLALLKHGAVIHDGGGQVGKVFFFEKRQWDFAQLFRKSNPAHTGFHIGSEVGVVIFQPCASHNEQRRRDAADHIEGDSLCRQRAVHEITHQQV